MGNDPSKGGGQPKGPSNAVGKGTGDVPYTSYSVDRSKNSQVKDIRAQNAEDIITVVEVNSGPRSNVEPELQALDRIATFEPLLKQSGWMFTTNTKPQPEMNPQALLKLCGEYQSFCRKISTVVSQQQTVLCTRMRAKEGQSLEASRTLQRHLGDVRQFEMAFRDVEKIRLQINTTKQLLNQVIAMAEEVCGQLPQSYQLSPIRSFIVDRSQAPLHAHTADGEHEEEGERRHAQQSEGDETEQSQQGRDHHREEDKKEEEEGGAIGDKDGTSAAVAAASTSSAPSEPAAGAEATPGAEPEPEPEPEAAQPALEPTAGELTSSS